MRCTKCLRSDRVTRSLFTPYGKVVELCAECRRLVDAGASFYPPRRAPKLASRTSVRVADFAEPEERAPIRATPFGHTTWGKKK